MTTDADALTTARREALAVKGRLLYGKFCGTGGRGICAESFAVYHISRGEVTVAEDLIAFLEATATDLAAEDPHNRVAATRGLAERIRGHVAAAGQPLPTAGMELREFVLENASAAETCG
jgi:hypothetical protein